MLVSSASFKPFCRCYAVVPFSAKRNLENGGKIILPPSALRTLSQMNIVYPMLFRIESRPKFTHCGVNGFTAEEGVVLVPHWIMQNLSVELGSLVLVSNVSLPLATFSLFKPRNEAFFQIQDHKSVLEQALGSYSCLTVGDVITISHEGQNHVIEVAKTEPENAVSIVECDMSVEFVMPPKANKPSPETSSNNYSMDGVDIPNDSSTFTGQGKRLTDKRPREECTDEGGDSQSNRPTETSADAEKSDEKNLQVVPFQGSGQTLFKRQK